MSTKLALVILGLLAIVTVACGGDSEKFPKTVVIRDGDVTPIITNSEIVVGENRLALAVLDKEGVPVVDAKMHLVFYELNSGTAVKRFEMDAVSRVPARDAGIAEEVIHIHTDGSRHAHLNAGDDLGVYTAVVNFDKPGDWGVEMQLTASDPDIKATMRPRFNVVAQSVTPAIGSPAPRSRNRTVADVPDISIIDSSAKPSPDMHTMTIADAIAARRPTLVLFAAPGFCTSRLCGPELEIMRKLYPQYRDRVEFIHVEFFQNEGTPMQSPVDVANEWNLRSEPWFFLIDAQGLITAKFEGPTSLAELDEVLKKVSGR